MITAIANLTITFIEHPLLGYWLIYFSSGFNSLENGYVGDCHWLNRYEIKIIIKEINKSHGKVRVHRINQLQFILPIKKGCPLH